MEQTLATRFSMNQTPSFIVLTAAIGFVFYAQSHAQMGKGRPRAYAENNAEPVWVLPAVQGSNLHHRTFRSAAVKEEVSYMIYLPDAYEEDSEARFPVVYWLHGKGGGQQGLPGFARGFNEAIAAGQCPPMIVVYPNGLPLGGYSDSPNGKQPVESLIIKDLIPHIDATFRTLPKREGRMIEGFSMGGSGSAKLGFKYAELFGGISIVSGAPHTAESLGERNGDMLDSVYGGRETFDAESNPWLLAERNAGQVRGRTQIRIAVGSRDPLRGKNADFHELLDRLKIEHEFTVIEGAPHSPTPVYDGLGDKNWAFYAKVFGFGAKAR
jgi:enterochelin esterase-like enzyme